MTGLNVVGMPFGMHGLGLELRDKVFAMQTAGIEICILNENYSSLSYEIRDPAIEALVTDHPKYDTNLICHNLPAIALIAEKNPQLFERRYNIGAPYWEFPQLPESHMKGLKQLDEIWVSTQFLSDCFTPHTDRPVIKMPLHMTAGRPKRSSMIRTTSRKSLVFGYVFDFNSMAARKDPLILITAFLECFASKPKANVKLIVKYKVEPSHLVRPRDVDDLVALAALDPRIELIDSPLSNTEMNALYNTFDVYVSPHRAEGLGRGILETMLKSKAVAATAYSGPAEFLQPDCAYALDYYNSHVGAAALGDIKSHFTWAEVKIESIIDALNTFADDPTLPAKYGKNAVQFLTSHHGAKAHGSACLKRILEIERER